MSAESTPPAGPPERAGSSPRRLGRYTLGTRLGEGGMGVVYRARVDGAPVDGSRDVAIKVLRPHIAHDPHARTRLSREVATLSRVSSPRVAAVLDADTEGPAPYIVTEFVPGPPLDHVVSTQGPVTGQALVDLGRGLSEALTAIHRVGIVHRDLKPGNVLMVGADPVVIDFGIAQVADDVRLTMTGLVMGTPGYLSPEVVEGGAVTEATDWWGWAATLAFAASGTPPFGSGPMSVVLDRVVRGRTQLDDVDPALRPLLAAALDPEPTRRPHSDEVMRALELYAEHKPVTEALTVHLPSPGTDRGPDATVAARGTTVSAPETTRTPQQEQTRVQPVDPTPRTRVAPVQQPQAQHPAGTQYAAPQGPRQRATYPPPQGAAHPAPQGSYPRPQQGVGYPPAQAAGPSSPSTSPYGPPAVDQQRFGQPMRGPDPRIGRPLRTGTLAAGLVALVGTAAVVPLVAWGILVLWSVSARTVDHAMTSLVLRRHEAGPRRSDVPVTVLTSPWHLFVAALSTGLALLLPLAFAFAASVITAGVLTESGLLQVGVEHPLPTAVGTLLGVLMAWWGPGGLSLRRGSRTMVRAMLPTQLLTQVVVAVLLAGGVALLVLALMDGTGVSWWPTTWDTAPFTDLIPQMLRP
ncbi:protein kinase [Ornithinimicrobium sp. F0845]|uniref:serine/threonine-protein kinase n=1 Tax=Ornithinimicrobium sp. F0845 TaxID=2926412 RepID=UPI001FF36086|nr:serine/threonine-protein kinase [Ornithinimicrobium sp. F0845]MCK0110816.1 protein kinase [Ornithinimicrobium sp. F0845]